MHSVSSFRPESKVVLPRFNMQWEGKGFPIPRPPENNSRADMGPATPISLAALRTLIDGQYGRLDENEKCARFAVKFKEAYEQYILDGTQNEYDEAFVRAITPHHIKKLRSGVTTLTIPELKTLNHMFGFFEMGVGKRWRDAGAFGDRATARATLLRWQEYFGFTQTRLGEIAPLGREFFSRVYHNSGIVFGDKPKSISSMANFYELMLRHPRPDYVPGGEVLKRWAEWEPRYDSDPIAFSNVLKKTLDRLGISQIKTGYKTENNVLSFCNQMFLTREMFSRHKNIPENREPYKVKKAMVRAYSQAFELWMDRHHIPMETLDQERVVEPAGVDEKRRKRTNGASPSGSSGRESR